MADIIQKFFANFARKFIDMGDGTHAERYSIVPPFDLMTDGGDGPNRRIRVDVAQTGFFGGREFRTFKELSISAGSSYIVKAVVPINLILFGLDLALDDGHLRLYTYAGGTEGGTFSESLPVIPRNTMTEVPVPYSTQIGLTAGGTHTGGVLLDVIRLKVEAATGSASSVGSSQNDERGVIAGTYYFHFENIGMGSVVGTFKARWEERP